MGLGTTRGDHLVSYVTLWRRKIGPGRCNQYKGRGLGEEREHVHVM